MPLIVPPSASQPITDKRFTMQQVFRTWTQLISRTAAGMPEGGTTGQGLAKVSATDYDTEWTDFAGPVAVEDEGTPLTTAVTKFNFVGSGVVATEPVADEITVTIAGGAAPVDSVFGRIGVVIAASGDYTAAQVTNAFDKSVDDTDAINEGTNKFVTNGANNLTSAEVTQLANIDTTTMSAAQWGYVGGADQAVKTTDDVTFDVITGTGIADFSAAGAYFKTAAAANLLDDYEEGAWTPVLSDGTNDAVSSTAIGRYVKVGRKVHAKARLTISSLGSASGAARITGLPFTTDSTSNTEGTCSFGLGSSLSIPAGNYISGYTQENSTYMPLVKWSSTTGITNLTIAGWSVSGNGIFEVTYYV